MAQPILKRGKSLLRRAAGRLRRDRPALLTFLFHGLFKDREEIARNIVDPQHQITVDDFRRFVAYFSRNGYTFVSPGDVERGLDPHGRYVMATFDDGYFRNQLALPVLYEFDAHAMFFISTNHLRESKGYWWDILYRRRIQQGYPPQQIAAERANLKDKTHEEIKSFLEGTFGPTALEPVGDIDRPFHPDELCAFSKHPYVHIGNHTSDHAVLTNYSYDGAKGQIAAAQHYLEELTGSAPRIISYPNGNYSQDVIRASEECGLKIGLTVEKRKNYLPLKESDSMRLGRFTLWGTSLIEHQCAITRSDFTRHGLFGKGRNDAS